MPTQIEARRLSGVDLGKTIEGIDEDGRPFDGKLTHLVHGHDFTRVHLLWEDNIGGSATYFLDRQGTLTVTGIPSPIVGPDCRDGKCRACYGGAYDEATDQIINCQCTCHN